MPETNLFSASPGRRRFLVMCGDDAEAVTLANEYARLLANHEVRFVEERLLSPGRVWKFCRRRLKKRGWLSLAGAGLNLALDGLAGGRKPKRLYAPEITTNSLGRDPAVSGLIESFRPEAILIGFCGLLPPAFLRRLACPVLNTHPGINPRYRGWGNVWAFYENNPGLAGYTVHLVDEGVDTGERLAAAAVDFAGVPFRDIDRHAARLMARHAAALALGLVRPRVPPEYADLPSAFYGLPTWTQTRAARRNYAGRRVDL